jgi:hypothetical protein
MLELMTWFLGGYEGGDKGKYAQVLGELWIVGISGQL